MDDLSKLTPIRREGSAALTTPPRRLSRTTGDGAPRQPETPWRLAVVEAWFARARQAGLDTIERRRRARLARERLGGDADAQPGSRVARLAPVRGGRDPSATG